MNDLHGKTGLWLSESDGSSGEIHVENCEIKASSESQETPFNIMYQVDVGSWHEAYIVIEIKELSGSLSVGLVKASDFLPGWKTIGMFYNGNVTNGRAALMVEFGENLNSGGTVGVYSRRNETGLHVTYYRNHRCLGTAFHLGSEDDFFFPCVQVSGSVTFAYSAPAQVPQSIDREYPKAMDQFLGEWKMYELIRNSKAIDIPADATVVFNISPGKSQHTYAVGVKVVNQIATTFEKIGKQENYDLIKVRPVMSTRMMPPAHLWSIEKNIMESLEKIQKTTVVNDDDLLLIGMELELRCKRFFKVFPPLHSYR